MKTDTLVTPAASTPSALRRGYGSLVVTSALLALSLDRNGSSMPAFAAQVDADAPEAKDGESVTIEVNVPSDAHGMSFAAGAINPAGQLVVVAKLDRALLTAPKEKLKDATGMVYDLFGSDGNVQNAPADYRTALLPASPADDQVLVTIADDQVTEIELPFEGTPEIARMSARKDGKQQIPAAYVVGKIGESALYAADESDAITGKPTWVKIADLPSPLAAIARENGSNEVVIQLQDGSYKKADRDANGYQLNDAEIDDDSAIPVGAKYLGLTSAYGDGNSHALFAQPTAAGKPTALTFVPTAKLPAVLFGAIEAGQA
ncbi:MAG: hypothetical protein HY565_01225 [Candidatus Kerfeldbacteria bacterium]|nr:hypothetical protein [Candidatus Kerfeldbacteria bacterium]